VRNATSKRCNLSLPIVRTEWTLTIDLRQRRDQLFLELGLLDKDRRHIWKETCEILEGVFRDMVVQISAFFDHDAQLGERNSRIERFHWLADRSFRFTEFLKSAEFSKSDSLTINTLITSIPWDLLPYDGRSLGNAVSIGLRIPTLRRSDPLTRAGQQHPRFLHVVANPTGDLHEVAEEVREIEGLVAQIQGLEYQMLKDPTPAALVSEFGAGRSTPFFHFTGHVSPKTGLVLSKGVLSVEHIVRYFPSERDQVVFLNGCDAVYGERFELGVDEPDLFQSASVANAFLDAGSEAVIAPRSRVSDREACRAATRIWKAILGGAELGVAVREFRQEMVAADPAAISGYSYVLYGEPSSRASLPPTSEQILACDGTDQFISQNEILREAWGDARGPVAPRHIFAALTRRWIVSQIFFSLEGQQYIVVMERLRNELGAGSPPPPAPPSGNVELTPAGHLVVEQALRRAGDAGLNDLALVEGLGLVNDPEVLCALESLRRGPRNIEAVVRAAREWVERGRPVPHTIVEPGGFISPLAFAPGVLSVEPGATKAPRIGLWDLLVAVLRAENKTSKFWAARGILAPPDSVGNLAHPLHWSELTDSLRSAIASLMGMLENEGAERVTEGQLVACLTEKEAFSWGQIPARAQDWLVNQGLDDQQWKALLEDLRMDCLTWT